MTDRVEDYDDFLEDDRPHWRRRLIVLATLMIVAVVGAVALWATVFRGGESTAAETQMAKVTLGTISKTISTSATTASQSTANLSFGTSGKVTTVNAAVGQEVKEGDVLAEVEATTLQDAVTRAEVNLSSAQTKLNELLKGSTAAELASADQSVIQAQANLDKAQTTLDDLYDGPTTKERDAAQQAVLTAQSQLQKAEAARAAVDTTWDDAVEDAEDAVDKAEDALDEAEQSGDEDAVDKAEDALDTAEDNLDDLGDGPDNDDIVSADMAIDSAELSLKMANDSLAELDEPPSEDDVTQAQYNVDSAAASLTAAEAKRDETYRGAEDEDISSQQDQVRLAQLSLNEAEDDLEKAQLIAPFDGTVAAVNIAIGETAGSGGTSGSSTSSSSAAIVLNTPDALVLNISVGESDLPSVEVGQNGTATFDAITDQVFPIVIDSISTNATTTQGVVTYQVKARIVERDAAAVPGAAQSGDLTAEQQQAIQERLSQVEQPVPGMNATVTIITDQAQNVLYVSDSAIQTEGPTKYVTVQKEDGSTEKVTVETGLSDGSNTEITTGLEEGQTVIIPGVTSTSSSSSQTTQQTDGFFGGDGPGGGAMPPMPGGGGQ